MEHEVTRTAGSEFRLRSSTTTTTTMLCSWKIWCWARCSLCDDQPPTGCWTSSGTYYSLEAEPGASSRWREFGLFSSGIKFKANIAELCCHQHICGSNVRGRNATTTTCSLYVRSRRSWVSLALSHAVLTPHWVSQSIPGEASSIEHHIYALSSKSARDTCQAVSKYVRCTAEQLQPAHESTDKCTNKQKRSHSTNQSTEVTQPPTACLPPTIPLATCAWKQLYYNTCTIIVHVS